LLDVRYASDSDQFLHRVLSKLSSGEMSGRGYLATLRERFTDASFTRSAMCVVKFSEIALATAGGASLRFPKAQSMVTFSTRLHGLILPDDLSIAE
jgi:hypothetical protein